MRVLGTLALLLGLTLTGLGPPAHASSASPGDTLALTRVAGSPLSDLDVAVGRRAIVTTRTPFSLVGVTWHGADPVVRVRVRAAGEWSSWQRVPVLEDGPDPGSEGETGVRGTQPWWVGPSDAVQVRLVGGSPRDAALTLIDPGADPVSTPTTVPVAKPGKRPKRAPKPTIRSRERWGADESWRDGGPYVNRTIKQVHLHHTATGNGYAPGEVRGLIRSMYRYHTHTLGWSDIGYNFLVDKYGRIWEGRAGGVGRPIRGAHTLGFNSASTGIAVIGNYDRARPSRTVVRALVQLSAWKLDKYGRHPRTTIKVRSRGSDRYAEGRRVRLPVIDGHRDTNDTACPGERLYAKLPLVRRRTGLWMKRFGR
jgi:hypothetical protein